MVVASVHTERVQEMLKRKLDMLQSGILEAAQESGILMRNAISSEIEDWAKTKRTGNLQRSFEIEVTENPFGASVRVANNYDKAPYARIHDRGGVIKPKRKKFLVFKYQKDGKTLWASKTQVRIRKKNYIAKARKAVKPQVLKVWKGMMKRVGIGRAITARRSKE